MFTPSESLNQSQNYYLIRLYAKGFGSVGGVTISDVCIYKLSGRMIDYYSNGSPSGYNMATSSVITTIDNKSWYKITSDFNNDETSSTDYSYSDLIRNYINIQKQNHYFWSDNLHNLTYLNSIPSATIFAKKSLVKQYKENDVVKDIYTFEYLEKNSCNKNKYMII